MQVSAIRSLGQVGSGLGDESSDEDVGVLGSQGEEGEEGAPLFECSFQTRWTWKSPAMRQPIVQDPESDQLSRTVTWSPPVDGGIEVCSYQNVNLMHSQRDSPTRSLHLGSFILKMPRRNIYEKLVWRFVSYSAISKLGTPGTCETARISQWNCRARET